MSYCDETDVHSAAGTTSAKIQTITGKTEAQVTTLITSFITWATQTIKDWIRIPIIQRRELHLGDGEADEWTLGPEDEDAIYSLSGSYNPENCVNKVYAMYAYTTRIKLPYPKDDCDLGCEGEASSWTGSNATISDETAIYAAGAKSIKAIFSAAGYIRYPSTEDLNKNIDIYDWVAFRFRTTDATKTFTFKLYDRSGNVETYNFTVHKANVWYKIMIKVDDMDGSIDWEHENVYYIDIYANGACTIYVDNLNFNDELFWTIPQGKLVHCHKLAPTYSSTEGELAEDYELYVTYDFDPFKVTTPANIEEACACLAAVKLFDHLLGFRVQDTGFVLDAEDETARMDRFTMEHRRTQLLERAKQLVGEYGYGWDSGTV